MLVVLHNRVIKVKVKGRDTITQQTDKTLVSNALLEILVL